MTGQWRFDGRTVIVTGAGGNPSLGRAHALLFGARGANVVVNDIGRSEGPNYTGTASAETVAEEIRAAGGKAVADTNSVASEEGAAAIIETAVKAFGGVDILVNNAGISIAAAFDEMTPADFRRHVEINMLGPYYTCHAAWPLMKKAGYGRIVNITSASMTGFSNQAAYCASKGGLWSLTRALAAEGKALGIKVNAVSPGAFTRMVSATLLDDSPLLQHSKATLPPELSSPPVVFLAHEDCPVTGECIDSVGGEVQRTFIGRTKGFADRAITVEMVAGRWEEVMSQAGATTVDIAAFDTSGWKMRPYAAKA